MFSSNPNQNADTTTPQTAESPEEIYRQMFPETAETQDEQDQTQDEDPAPPKKRNCGRTGPTSAAGRAKSAQNALKHGACARTLILPTDSAEGWDILYSRWLEEYQPREASLEADFVLRTAQAEWDRLRCKRAYDDFLKTTNGEPLFMCKPEQIKMHDLMLRYKNTAERSFHREYRALEAHYKSHKLATAEPLDPGMGQSTDTMRFVCVPAEQIRQQIMADRGNNPLPPLFPAVPSKPAQPPGS